MKEKKLTNGSLALQEKELIVIEAAQKPEDSMLRVAAYARVSSDSSDQLNSFMAQTNYYATLIASKENWRMVDIYADEAISGTSAEKRPDFQRLLSDCRKGRIDRVLVKSISRFARNAKDCLETVRELKSIGVGVHFEEQNIDTTNMTGELLTAVFAAIAQKESESISGNMRWSYKRRMESGTYLPSAMPYGYVIRDHSITVDEPSAQIVRRIFRDYLAGISMNEIADQLNRENIPVRIGNPDRKWMHSAISYILSNERYIGDSLWQKTYATDTLPARQVRNRGEREKYYAEGTHPPIIEKEIFLAVQELRNRRGARITTERSENPLLHALFCGECGTVFHRKVCRGKIYWVCRNHFRSAQNCPLTQIPEEEIHAAFLRLYHKLRYHGETIFNQMIVDLQAIRDRRMLWRLDIVELNKRISDLNDQNRLLADLNRHGVVDSDIFISQSNELEAQLRAAKREKEKLIGGRDDDIIPKTRELLELLDTMPEYLHTFDGDIFGELVEKIIAVSNEALRFRLTNGLEITEHIERTVR